jgi:hypothetical protein
VGAKATDFISCTIFKTLFGVVDELKVMDKDVYKRWKASLNIISPLRIISGKISPLPSSLSLASLSLPPLSLHSLPLPSLPLPSTFSPSLSLPSLPWLSPLTEESKDSGVNPNSNPNPNPHSSLLDLEFLQELLKEKEDYLNSYCHYKLLALCADKVVMVYLTLFKDAGAANKTMTTDGPEVAQLNIDINAIKSLFTVACRHKDLENYTDAIHTHLRPLRHALSLISHARDSAEFKKTLQTILKVTIITNPLPFTKSSLRPNFNPNLGPNFDPNPPSLILNLDHNLYTSFLIFFLQIDF